MQIKLIEEVILEMPKDARYINEYESNKNYSLVSLSTKYITYRNNNCILKEVGTNTKRRKHALECRCWHTYPNDCDDRKKQKCLKYYDCVLDRRDYPNKQIKTRCKLKGEYENE